MIVVSTPLRISLMGGGSDIPAYFREHLGSCVSMAINKHINVAVAPSEGNVNRIMSDGFYTDVDDHPFNATMARVKACQQAMDYDTPIDVASFSDIPSHGTGMGSSSAFTVGMLDAIHFLKHNRMNQDRQQIAEIACHVEINMCNENIGKQDQYAAAFGGVKRYTFSEFGAAVEGIRWHYPMLNWFHLYYTGIKRKASDILKNKTFDDKLMDMVMMVKPMCEAIEGGNYTGMAVLLDSAWELKKQDPGVTNDIIDKAYDAATVALGGKILGAGGGGYLLFMAEPSQRFILDSQMKPFGFKRYDFGIHEEMTPVYKVF